MSFSFRSRIFTETVLLSGVSFLFLFVSLVPHRFMPETVNGAQFVAFIPSIVAALLALVVLFSRGLRTIQHSDLLLPFLAILSLNVISGLSAEIPMLALSRLVYYGLTGVCLTFVVLVCLSSPDQVSRIVRISIIGASCVAFYGILEYAGIQGLPWSSVFVQDNLVYSRFASDDFSGRIMSSVGHPVYLGAYLVLFLPLTLSTAMASKGGSAVWLWSCTGLIVIALLLTFSRGAWVGAIVSLIYVLNRVATRRIWLTLLAVSILVVATLCVDGVWETVERRSPLKQIHGYRNDARGTAYEEATDILSIYPLLGSGVAHYRYLGRYFGDQNSTPDNTYLKVLAESGTAGLVALTVLISAILARLRTLGSVEGGDEVEMSDVSTAVAAGVVGFLIDMITCDALAFPLTRVSFWILVGIGLAASEKVVACLPNEGCA
jgi:O-antigen ligase